jgi:aspartate aminotransferase
MHQRLVKARADGLTLLSKLDNVPTPRADGAFFFYLDVSALLASLPFGSAVRTTDDIARLLLEETGVGSVAGETFGDPNGLRLSFGAPPDLLIPALGKVVDMLNGLKARQVAA